MFTIASLRHTVSRIWTFAKPNFWLCSIRIWLTLLSISGPVTLWGPTFLHSKKKKEKQREKKSFKAEAIKRLSPKSKCYCFSHSRAHRIQKCFLSSNHGDWQYFSVFHGSSTFKSISMVMYLWWAFSRE